jgi:hypothetical protein
MAINLIDRVCCKKTISRKRYQLVGTHHSQFFVLTQNLGITCLFIACKYEDIYPPTLYEFTYVCDNAYQQKEVLAMEGEILSLLDFELVSNSSYLF